MQKRSYEDTQERLRETLYFLERSNQAYDSGHRFEAKPLANYIMMLVHDQGSNHSILDQLGYKEDLKYFDSGASNDIAMEMIRADLKKLGRDPNSQFYLQSPRLLVVGQNTPKFAVYEPIYDSELDQGKWLNFSDWWEQIVFTDQGNNFSRKELVRYVRNKDGGAHVDPSLPNEYHSITRAKSMNMKLYIDEKLIIDEGPTFPTIRQISFELLYSIKQHIGPQKSN